MARMRPSLSSHQAPKAVGSCEKNCCASSRRQLAYRHNATTISGAHFAAQPPGPEARKLIRRQPRNIARTERKRLLAAAASIPRCQGAVFAVALELFMAPRAYWKGYLKLLLVSCPVALFP